MIKSQLINPPATVPPKLTGLFKLKLIVIKETIQNIIMDPSPSQEPQHPPKLQLWLTKDDAYSLAPQGQGQSC